MIEAIEPNESINLKTSKDNLKSNKILGNNSSNPTKKSPNKKHNNYGRNAPIDSDLYYQVKEENVQLKRTQVELNEKIKKMDVALSNIKTNIGRERVLSDRPAIPLDRYIESDIETLKIENENYKIKVTKMKTIIQGLQTELRQAKSKKAPKSAARLHQGDNDYINLIEHLRKALKDSQDDRRNLINDLTSLKESNASKQIMDYSDDLRSKSTQVAELVTKYDRVTNQFNTNVKILELTKQGLQEYMEKYTTERNKNKDLEEQIQLQQASLSKVKEYADLIEDYKNKEKILEERISDLCENPFIKQANERDKAFLKLRENELALIESQRRLKEANDRIGDLNESLRKVNEECSNAKRDRDLYKEEGLRYRIENEEKEKISKNFDANLKTLGKYGEVESGYDKMLDKLKEQSPNDNNEWMNIDFLEKMDENHPEITDPQVLHKEIERLKIDKGILGTELEKTKSLLSIQQQINEDMKTVEEYDKQKYHAEIKVLRQKIDDLLQLIDIDRLPKDYLSQSIQARHLTQGLLPMQRDQITEFSKAETESDFAVNENCLDLYISKAEIDDNIQAITDISPIALMSFISVDFFIHETQTSEMTNGKAPKYNLQLSFKVNVDEHFIHYLDSDHINIELYYNKEGHQVIIGKGRLPLKSLIECEMPNKKRPSRVINSIVQIFYVKDENIRIATIHYKMRMRNPIVDVLKWYMEKTSLINEINPVERINQKLNEQLAKVNYAGKKAYVIRVGIKKAYALKMIGQPRKMKPYFFYKMYMENEHYSEIATGDEPEWDDNAEFTIVYDQTFHDYIEKEALEVYLFDNSQSLEVECGYDVQLVSNDMKKEYDLIGISRVPLCDLLLKDLVQGRFMITNEKGEYSGEIEVTIQWQEVCADKTRIEYVNNPNTLEGMDPLLLRLGKVLREKGLDLNSAFEIFDTERQHLISIVDFKNVLLFTLKFSSNQEEIDHLTNVVFQGKTRLNKIEFYKIFAMLLDQPRTMNNNGKGDQSMNNNAELPKERSVYNVIDSNDQMRFSVDKSVAINKSNIVMDVHESVSSSHRGLARKNISVEEPKEYELNPRESNRNIREIMILLHNYMINFGKRQPVDIFKMFDKDADLKVGKSELCQGFTRMDIYISTNELNTIWLDLCQGIKGKDKFDFLDFKAFYEKNKVVIQQQSQIQQSQMQQSQIQQSQMQQSQNRSLYQNK